MCNKGTKCKYQDRCVFAHTSSELRCPEENASKLGWDNYKTQVCHFYYNHGTCKFGDKCTFLHIKRCEMERRLPVFRDITNDTIVV